MSCLLHWHLKGASQHTKHSREEPVGMRKSNKALGLKRPPSGFALFCSAMAQIGVVYPLVRRLVKKTPSRSKARCFFLTTKIVFPSCPWQDSVLARWQQTQTAHFSWHSFIQIPGQYQYMNRLHDPISIHSDSESEAMSPRDQVEVQPESQTLGRAEPTCSAFGEGCSYMHAQHYSMPGRAKVYCVCPGTRTQIPMAGRPSCL